ncbi:MAG: PD40 domain-containing protein, partial [Deltaproteobacteria bacterium]|nr:PD40 domain-containing protein [Deltaproteobacteria bacterium]
MRTWGKVLFILVVVSGVVALSTLASAASFDPALKWRTITTPHFRVNYPDHLEDVGQKAARYYEEVHATLSPELQWKPWGRTQVVLTDNTDEANGFTTVLPYNWMILYIVPPRADSVLGTYDDWLKLLITHEYTHTLHLDAAHGLWKPLRLLFGRITSPAGMTPVWIKEGIATYEETKHTAGGRGRSTFTEMMIRTSVLEDQFPRIDEADGFGWEWPSYRIAYLYGVEFIEYLVDTYGEAKFIEFNKRVQRSLLLFMINHHAKALYDKTFYQLWDEWYAKVKEKYQHERDERGSSTELTSLFNPEKDARYLTPEFSPDGTKLAYTVESPHHAAHVRLFDVATEKETIVRKKQGALAISWLPDGSGFVYSAIGSYKRYNSYYDLWQYTFADKKAVRLTHGKRARDPAVHPDGDRVLVVTGSGGKSALEVFSLKEKSLVPLDVSVAPDAQFSRPRWSPDGKQIAVTIHTSDAGWKLYLLSADGKKLERLTKVKGMASEVDAMWLPDGRSLLFSSDVSGISNIYRMN